MKCPKCNTENSDAQQFCGKCGIQLIPAQEISLTKTKIINAPLEEINTGSTFAGRYQIIEELGKGGMGRVYKANDTEIREKVALKLIKPEISGDKMTIERFRNELKYARKIRHKNVCQMFDLNKDEGTYYITMEYVAGQDLKKLIRQTGKLAISTAISITQQVCEGLAEAHKLGIVHRDLKSNNIMIDEDGNARIMDFGIARSVKGKGITGSGVMIGTPEYMSPEQVEGKEVDQRSDIYSLGVILYEMVTGHLPFGGETALSIAVKHKTEVPREPIQLNAQIPEELNRMILRCIEKDKDKRYQSAGEMRSELENIEKGIPTKGRAIPKGKSITSKEITVTFGLKKLLVPALIFIAVVIIGVVIWQLLPEKEAVPPPATKPSIAVLPFEDLSPQKDQGHICFGFAESIITALTKIKDLHVPAPTSSRLFIGKEQDMKEIGEKLKVKTVFRGSVQISGNMLRISAQIINVADESLLWSEQYNGEMDDVFAIQDEINLAIVDKLKIELLGGEKEKLVKRYTDDPEAYNLYMLGQYFWPKFTEEAIKKGIEYFEQAIQKDPDYALAYAGLAKCYGTLGIWGYSPPSSVWPRAKAEVNKALELDDTLAEVHSVLSVISLYYDWDWPAFEKHIKRAIELAPGYAEPYIWKAEYLRYRGRFDEAIEEAERALELDPLLFFARNIYSNILDCSGRSDEAIEQVQKTLEMDPNHSFAHAFRGVAYFRQGKYEEAISTFQKVIKLAVNNPHITGRIGAAYAKSGQREKAMNVLRQFEEQSEQQYIPKTSLAGLYVALGEIDRALELLERAYEERDNFLLAYDFKCIPYPDNIHLDPRLIALRKKMGLE